MLPAVAPSGLNPILACRHHWLIEVPDGPTSDARCKLCGATRQFRNHAYGLDRPLGIAARTFVKRVKREEAIVTGIIKQLGGGMVAKRADVPYEPPIEYRDDGSER